MRSEIVLLVEGQEFHLFLLDPSEDSIPNIKQNLIKLSKKQKCRFNFGVKTLSLTNHTFEPKREPLSFNNPKTTLKTVEVLSKTGMKAVG